MLVLVFKHQINIKKHRIHSTFNVVLYDHSVGGTGSSGSSGSSGRYTTSTQRVPPTWTRKTSRTRFPVRSTVLHVERHLVVFDFQGLKRKGQRDPTPGRDVPFHETLFVDQRVVSDAKNLHGPQMLGEMVEMLGEKEKK